MSLLLSDGCDILLVALRSVEAEREVGMGGMADGDFPRGRNDLKLRPAAERVREGAKYLDRKVPGWWKSVDRKRLRMESDTSGVAEQVSGFRYIELDERRKPDACDRLGITAENEAALGFAPPLGTCKTVARWRLAFAELDNCWDREVAVRESQGAPRRLGHHISVMFG